MARNMQTNFTLGAKVTPSFNNGFMRAQQQILKTNRLLQGAFRMNARVASSTGNWVKNAAGLAAAYVSLKSLSDGYTAVTTAANESQLAQQRLQTLMSNVKGTRQQDIESIMRYASALQRVSIVEDDATVSGASQLATYQIQAKYIKQLLPAMQDLAVGQYGVNVNQQQMIQSGNLMGKVFTGQIGALRRAGVSFNKQQEQVMKFGTQAQKTAMLVKVLSQNYGGLSRSLAKTPEGVRKQFENAFGDVKEEVGFRILPLTTKFFQYMSKQLPTIQRSALRMLDSISAWFVQNKQTFVRVWRSMQQAYSSAKPTLKWFFTVGLPRIITLTMKIIDYTTRLSNWFIKHWDSMKFAVGGVVGAILLVQGAIKTAMAIEGVLTMIGTIRTLKTALFGAKGAADALAVANARAAGAGALGSGAAVAAGAGVAGAAGVAGLGVAGVGGVFYKVLDDAEKATKRSQVIARKSNQAMIDPWTALLNKGYSNEQIEQLSMQRYHLKYQALSAKQAAQLAKSAKSVLPHHANGGMVTRQQISWLAEGNKPELVLPLSKPGRTQQLMQAHGLGGNTIHMPITVNVPAGSPVDGRVIGRSVADEVRRALADLLDERERRAFA